MSKTFSLEIGERYRVTKPGAALEWLVSTGGGGWSSKQVALPVGAIVEYLGSKRGWGSDNIGVDNFSYAGKQGEFSRAVWGMADKSFLEPAHPDRMASLVPSSVAAKIRKLMEESRFDGYRQFDDPFAVDRMMGTYGPRIEQLPKFYLISPKDLYYSPVSKESYQQIGELLGDDGEARIGAVTISRHENVAYNPPYLIEVRVNTQHKVASIDPCKKLLGLLHGVYFLLWTSHWQSQGDPSYADHLLFERLYLALVDEIDGLAEKMVQMYGKESVALESQFPIASAWVSQWVPESDIYGRALGAERDLQKEIKATYDGMKAGGVLSLGMDDFLMSMANTHETHLYLLQQRMGGILKTSSEAPSEEARFFDSPRKRETRDFAQSGAMSNVSNVSSGLSYDNVNGQPKAERQRLRDTPMTPSEVVKQTPGGSDFSALSRYVVQTEQPTDRGVPQSHDQITKHPDIS